jgi:hypothetical protein
MSDKLQENNHRDSTADAGSTAGAGSVNAGQNSQRDKDVPAKGTDRAHAQPANVNVKQPKSGDDKGMDKDANQGNRVPGNPGSQDKGHSQHR